MTTSTVDRPLTKLITLEEFLARPETKPASEFALGEVSRKPMPTSAHGKLQFYFTLLITQFLAKNPIGIVIPEWRCTFGQRNRKRSYVPDVTFASFERTPHGDLNETPYLLTAPNLIVEVVSPRQSPTRFASKIEFYLRNGVLLIWVVDPRRKTISVYTSDGEEQILRIGDTLDGGDVLKGFNVAVADVFAQLQV